LTFCNFQVKFSEKFSRKWYQHFLFFSICWLYCCEQHIKEFRKFDENFEAGGVKEKRFPPAISP